MEQTDQPTLALIFSSIGALVMQMSVGRLVGRYHYAFFLLMKLLDLTKVTGGLGKTIEASRKVIEG